MSAFDRGSVLNGAQPKKSRKAALLSGFSAAATFIWALPAIAQDADADDVIVVTGIRASIESSLNAKRESVNVVDYITSEDIGKFPDTNLSESLQRVPGVTIGRSETGEGKEINLRGLGPEFSRTEVNGGSGINGFDFTVLPAEMFERIAVEKSPTAQTVEGALAGVVRAETPKPFNHDGARVAASASAVIGENGHASTRLFGLVSKNWDDRFGVSLSGTFSNPHFESSQISHGSWVPFRNVAGAAALLAGPPVLLDAATPRTTGYYSYTEDRDNYAGAAALQFSPSDQWDATLDLLYAKSDGARTDDRPDAPVEGGNSTPTNYVITDGAVTSATFTGIQNRVGTSYKPSSRETFQGNLRVNWRPNESWTISPGVGIARYEAADELNLYSFAINGADVTYAVDGDIPNFTSTATDFSSNPEDFGFNVLFFDRNRTKVEEDVLTLDTTRSFGDSPLSAVHFGLRYADRTNTAADGTSSVLVGSSATVLGLADSSLAAVFRLRDFSVSGAPSQVPSQILAVDVDAARMLYHPNTDGFEDGTDFIVFDHGEARNYAVNEKTLAGYASLDAEIGALRMNAGLRVVRTKSIADGNQVAGSVITPRHVENTYTDYLPSISLAYEALDDGFVRASYSRTVNRPSLSDLSPSQTINPGPRTGSRGNPELQPYRADQVDLGFEYYFHDGALFQLTGFVKEIGTLITQQNVDEVATFPDQLTGQPISGIISFTQPVNGDEATVKGIETGFTTPLYFLGGFAEDFGVIFNYTYAQSEATTRASDGSSRSTPLPGLSKHSLNAALYFDRGGLDSRLAYTWRSEYLRNDAVGRQFGAERYIDGYGQLDYSLTVPIADALKVSFEALNILDEQTGEFTLLPNGAKLPSNITEKERIFLITARASF